MTRILALLRGFRDVFRIWRLGYGVKVIVRAKITFDRAGDEDDSCEAAFVEELGPEWLAALEAADYSDLPKLKKIHA